MAILRSVARTDTFEIQRQKINLIAQDLFTVQTSVGSGAFSMSDGSAAQPALYFTNAIDVGIFKGDESLYISAKGATVANFSETSLTALQDFSTLISSIPNGTNGITITNGGGLYASGTFANVLLSGGTGKGARAEVTVDPLAGEILNGGGGYVGGSYLAVPLTGGSGSNALADITVIDFSGTIQNGGSGGNPLGAGQQATFTNVTLTGGTGSGMLADITITDGGASVNVTDVLITDLGSGYSVNDVLSAPPAQIGNVSGFEFIIVGVGNVSEVSIDLADDNYLVGDILSASDADLGGGGGSGFQFEVTGVGIVSDISISDGGDGYIVGDLLSVEPIELSPAEEYWTKMEFCQLVEFSGSTGSGFNIGDTLTYNGGSRPIVKKFANAVTIEASGTTGGILTFSAGLTADDGNGNVLSVTAIGDGQGNTGALNYFFAPTANGPWTNVQDFTLEKNKRYIFDQTDGSNAGHPIRLSTTPDGIHTLISGVGANAVYGEVYEGEEVDYNYTSTAIAITPNENTPSPLYYFCEEGIADQLNEHINEGGFNGYEGELVVSGTAQISGAGAVFTVAQVSDERNIILQKDGSATLGDTTLNALEINSTLTVSGITQLSNDLIVGGNKFVVDFSTGDTVIDGGLSVAGDLSFLADAAFGGTLYVDSVNNKVSVNIDPAVTPLTVDFEVAGDSIFNGNVDLSFDENTIVSIGSSGSGLEKLQVAGSIASSGKMLVPATDSILEPTYTFSNNERIGISVNTSDESLSFVSTSGEIVKYNPGDVNFYRNLNFNYLEIIESKITKRGSDYVYGSFSGAAAEGGTGSGLFADLIVSFECPIGAIASVTNISAADATRVADVYTISGTDYTTSGDGVGASFEITVDGTGACSVVILESGELYSVGETITVTGGLLSPGEINPSADLTFDIASLTSEVGAGYSDGIYEGIPLDGGSGLNAFADITIENGSVKEFIVINHGNGQYQVGDALTFDYINLLSGDPPTPSTQPTTAASLTIRTLGTLSKVSIQNFGEGYLTGDVLTFPSLQFNFFSTNVAEFTILQTNAQVSATIDNDTGLFTATKLITTESGIDVDGELNISGSTISSLINEDVIINPGLSQKLLSVSGTGGVKIPVGDSTNRPAATTLGIIRYNQSTQQYEGSNGSDFISLGGVRDVDGNTYILAEEFVGANDNTLWFYNDAINTARLTTTEFTLITPQVIASREISPPRVEWEAGASATAAVLPEVNYVYYGDNLYSVDSTGTFDTDENNAPIHTSGTVLNGSVDLTFVSTVFGPLTFKASNITLDATLTLSGLDIYSYNTTALVLDNSLTTTEFAFGKENGAPDTLALLTSAGELQFNRNYDTTDPQDNLTVLDKTLKFIELDDVLIKTVSINLERGLSDTATIAIYDPTIHTAAKVMIVADNTTSDQRHMVEYSVIAAGSNISVTEFGSVHTDIELFQVTFGFSPSGEISVNPVLNSAITAGDNVKIVTTFTITKK
jgi:hypothetical protein